MPEKRKDSKGRVLRNGEVQRSDGKYMFRYTDLNGERQAVYSWKLVETDKAPSGKRCTEALRTIEQRVLKDVEEGINTSKADKKTINMLFADFMQTRTELSETTRCTYQVLYDTHIKNGLGRRSITSIKYSDIFKFYMSLSQEKNLKISTVRSINGILWQLLEIPTKDNLIRKNPASGAMAEVAHKLKEEDGRKNSLTVEEQSSFIDYVYASKKYNRYGPLFTTLLGTGMRIGECLGLRWSDVNFDKGLITVDHAICYRDSEDGGYKYRITNTKTKAGIRTIPLLSGVREALQREKDNHKPVKTKFEVDGYSGFIFLNSVGKVYPPHFVFDTIQNIIADYNRDEFAMARKENREPVLLPKFGPHVLRHTFCTRLCENETNLKVIQDVMGHKNIRTTMNVYADATDGAKISSFANLDGKIKVS